MSTQRTSDWYCALRLAQGQPDMLFDGRQPFMIDSTSFLSDSLFCEYAYVINFDTGMLEFYRGFNKNFSAPGRFANIERDAKTKYAGVALSLTIPLSEITSDEAAQSVVDRMNEAERAAQAETD